MEGIQTLAIGTLVAMVHQDLEVVVIDLDLLIRDINHGQLNLMMVDSYFSWEDRRI